MKVIAGIVGLSLAMVILAVVVLEISTTDSRRVIERSVEIESMESISGNDVTSTAGRSGSSISDWGYTEASDSTLFGNSDEEQRAIRALYRAFVDPEGSAEFQSALQDALSKTHGAEEASFYLDYMNARSWDEVERIISERSVVTGQNYNELRMQAALSMGMGANNADEILRLAELGTPVPENAIHRLARSGDVETV